MKRKVIQIADSTQLISLPRKWALQHGIKKGDELDVKEEVGRVIITTDQPSELMSIELDVTGLDRTSLLYCIECLYRLGYDEVKINFKKPKIRYLRVNEDVKVISVIHYATSRLPGFEVIQEMENFCLIKDIQRVSPKEFDSMFKRIFLLLLTSLENLVRGIETENLSTIEMIKENHDSITKFVSYSLRLLNKTGYKCPKNDFILYHILSDIDKVADILKSVSRDIVTYKILLSKDSISIIKSISKSFMVYQELFYHFDTSLVHKISEVKEGVTNNIRTLSERLDRNELLLLTDLKFSLEILTSLTEARWALRY